MQETSKQNNESAKISKPIQVFEKIRQLIERGKFQDVGQKRMRESEKKKLIRKQRQLKYANLQERRQDVVFVNQQFIKQFRAKLEREKLEQIQIEYQKTQQVSRPRNNQMVNKNNISSNFNPQESYNMMSGDFTDIESYLEMQSSKNILDRVEKKELQLLQTQDQNTSLSFSQSINFAFNSLLPQQKRIFPFENYQPKYKENDLNQLAVEESYSDNNDDEILNSVNEVKCFTQYNDQYFGFALTNGMIVVKDIISHRKYEVNSLYSSKDKNSYDRAKDITSLQLTPDLRHIMAVHETGAISMYDFKYGKTVFHIKNLFKYSSTELESRNQSNLVILDFKVIAQNSQKDEIFLLAVNAWGDCVLSKIFKGFLSFENQAVHLLKNEIFPLTQINILGRAMQQMYFQYDYDREDDFIAAISSPEKIFIIRIKLQKMKAKLIYKYLEKQDSVVKKPKNSFAWGEIKIQKDFQLMFLTSFSNNLYIGILSKVQEESIKDQGKMKIRNKYSFDLKKRIRHYTSIQFIGTLFRNIFLICDFNNQFYLINSTDFRASFSKFINLTYVNSFKIKLPDINIKPTCFNLDSTQLQAQNKVRQQVENSFYRQHTPQQDNYYVPIGKTYEQRQLEINRINKQQIAYSNSVSFSIALQKCYILLNKSDKLSNKSQIITINLVSWRQTLEELIKQGEYLNSMSFLYSIYQGYHKFSHNGLQRYDLKDLLIPQIERTALNYAEKVLKSFRDEQVTEKYEQNSFCIQEDKVATSSQSSIETQINNQTVQEHSLCDIQNLNEHDRIIFCMEFLAECQLSDCIFYEIRPMCRKILGSMDYFIECIEPFILEGKINNIPNDVLTEVIDYYQQRNNLRTIQQILTSLDLQHLDTKPLVQLSMEKQLITALIYLSTRSQIPDFITPLMVFWNQFVTSLRQWEQKYKGKSKSFIQKQSSLNPEERSSSKAENGIESIIRDFESDEGEFLKEQIILSFVRDPLKIKCEYYGLRALWYFRLCMQQRLIDGEYISDENYKIVTLSFEAWISFPDNIKVCLQRWPQVFFSVLKIFFSEKPMKIINTDQNKLKQYIKEIDLDKLKEQTLEFCGNKKKILYSEVLLRQIIHITIEIDSSFDQVTRSTVGRNAISFNEDSFGGGYFTQDNQAEDQNEDQTDLTGYQVFVEKSNPAEFDGRLTLRRKNLKSSFYLFLANLIYESQCSTESTYLGGLFQLNTQKVIEIVFYIIQNYRCLDQMEFTQEQLNKQAKAYQLGIDHPIDYKELAQLIRSDFLLSLILYILPHINPNKKENLQYLSQLLDLTEFATARSHVLLLREHYHRAIDSYIQSPNKTISRLIFEWMWQNLTQSQTEDQKKFELLKEIMRIKLPDFIKIDSEKTHQLFQKFLNDAEHDIISQLKNNPSLQLLYIQNVVKQYKLKIKADPSGAENMKFDSTILILNISLMCQLNKPEEEVLQEITSLDFYPFKEILKICLEKQYLEVCSHIYLRMGLQDQALRQQIKMMENTLTEYKKYLEDFFSKMNNLANESFIRPLNALVGDLMDRHQSYQFGVDNMDNEEENESRINVFAQRTESTYLTSINLGDLQSMNQPGNPNEQISKFNKKIEQRMQQMFEICQINKQNDQSDNWFLMLDLLLEIGKKYPDMDTQDSLKNLRRIYAQIIGSTIMEIANHIDMDDLLNKLRISYTEISIADLKETFSQLLQNSIDSFQILFNCLIYIQQDIMNLMNSAAETFLKGTHSSNYCSTCYDPLNSMDKIKRKIRKQVIQRSQITLASEISIDGSTASLIKNSSINEEEDEDSCQIIIFSCGHSYHKECYYRQKNVRICLECAAAKNKLYFLIISRQDIDFSKLTNFIKKQQELLLERYVQNRASSDASFSRSSSYFDTVKLIMSEEEKEIKQFNKLRRMNKLKNFDKVKQQKYSFFENDPVKERKSKQTS